MRQRIDYIATDMSDGFISEDYSTDGIDSQVSPKPNILSLPEKKKSVPTPSAFGKFLSQKGSVKSATLMIREEF